MNLYACSQHRGEALARLAGELTPLQEQRFDAHQRGCDGCQRFFLRLGRALAAAREEPPAPSQEEIDRGFEALLGRLELAAPPAEPARASRGQPAWRVGAVAAVAAAAVAAAAIAVFGLRSPAPAPAPAPAPRAAAAPLVAASPRPGLDLRAEGGTEWHLEGSAERTTLVLRRGTVYVRLAPLPPGRSFVLRTHDLRVRIVGTVIRATSRPGQASEVVVLRGAVVVEPLGRGSTAPSKSPRPVTLLGGEALRAGGERGGADPRDYGPVRDWLAEVPAHAHPAPPPAVPAPGPVPPSPVSAPVPARGAVPPRTEPARPPDVLLTARPRRPRRHAARPRRRQQVAPARHAETPPALQAYPQVERLLRSRDASAAAARLERALAAAPGSAEADLARLELATLYAGPLGRPAAAVRHLRVLVGRGPGAPGAAAARALLCRLATDDARCTSSAAPRD